MSYPKPSNPILADGRWQGAHGIGRFATEILPRLQQTDILLRGPKPLSVSNLLWQPYYLRQHAHKVFFTPGFNPVLFSSMPFVITIHDLIHLHMAGKDKHLKHAFYEAFIKPTAQRAYRILTVSDYSRQNIIEWTGIPPQKIVNVSCGISAIFQSSGEKHQPGYPYLLHVGNTKPHKNIPCLLQAFAKAQIEKNIRLIITGKLTPRLKAIVKKNQLENRVIESGALTEMQLAAYYRGATALVFPSLYEGFGLPPLEAMACGTPALTSTVTSMPETSGDAALLVNPYETDAIVEGIERIVNEETLRSQLIAKGFKQAALYSWNKTAIAVQEVLDSAI